MLMIIARRWRGPDIAVRYGVNLETESGIACSHFEANWQVRRKTQTGYHGRATSDQSTGMKSPRSSLGRRRLYAQMPRRSVTMSVDPSVPHRHEHSKTRMCRCLSARRTELFEQIGSCAPNLNAIIGKGTPGPFRRRWSELLPIILHG
jgi:hypothetical protein